MENRAGFVWGDAKNSHDWADFSCDELKVRRNRLLLTGDSELSCVVVESPAVTDVRTSSGAEMKRP